MQAVFDSAVMPREQVFFARRRGRDYMMRSEKRDGYRYGGSSSNGKKPKKRRRAGFFYIFLTLILSILFWPIGMILMWRRRLRWKLTTKLLTSIVTLALCVLLYGFALTYPTQDPKLMRIQDSANDFLDNAFVKSGDAFSAICDKAGELGETVSDLGDAAGRWTMVRLADGVDAAVEWTSGARQTVSGWFDRKDTPVEPDVSLSPTEEAEITAEPTVSAAPTATIRPTATPAATDEPIPSKTPSATKAPAATVQALTSAEATARAVATEAPTDKPTQTPTGAPTKAPTGEPAQASTAEPTENPTAKPTPEPTEKPTPEPTEAPVLTEDLLPKPAGEAVVYYNASGVNYHMRSSCKNMSTAKAGTLADAVERGLRRCKNCQSPDASILDAEHVVWTDEAMVFHLSDECGRFSGMWSLKTLEDALSEGYEPCPDCNAGLYMTALGLAVPTPTPEPTPTPAPTTVVPSTTLKPAGEAMVYHSSNGSYYHRHSVCQSMTGSDPYTFRECVEDGYKWCRRCGAPEPELLDEHCLWLDEANIAHTSDECASFDGEWTLISRDEALAEGYVGCPDCGADEYLVPNSIVDYGE